MIAFGNLLNIASQLIPAYPFSVYYIAFNGGTVNSMGIYVDSYASPVAIENCHIQDTDQKTIEQKGLQPGRNYKTLYIPANAIGTSQKTASDKINIGGRLGKNYSIIDAFEWFDYDGWNKVIIAEDKEI